MTRLIDRIYAGIALTFVLGMVLSLLAAASIRLIFTAAAVGELMTALIGLFAVPIGVVIAGQRADQTRNYLVPAVVILSVCWTLAIVGSIVFFEIMALPYRNNPAACPCSLPGLTDLISKEFPKANAVLSLVLGAIFASNKSSTEEPAATPNNAP